MLVCFRVHVYRLQTRLELMHFILLTTPVGGAFVLLRVHVYRLQICMIGLILETNRMIGFNPGKGGGVRGENQRRDMETERIYVCMHTCIDISSAAGTELPRLSTHIEQPFFSSTRKDMCIYRPWLVQTHSYGHLVYELHDVPVELDSGTNCK